MELRKEISYCFQAPYLFRDKVIDNILFPYTIRNKEIDMKRVEELFLLFMAFNAAMNASKRGKEIKDGSLISFIAIFLGATITLSILVLSGAIKYEAYQMIPVGGMMISNAMVALGLCYRQMTVDYKNKREEVETKLSLLL